MVRMYVSRGEVNKAFEWMTIKKVDSVPLPFLILHFFIAFVNQVNTSLAALQIYTNQKRFSTWCGYDRIIERTQEQCKQP